MTGFEDDAIEIELEKSAFVNKRNELMHNAQVPTLSDATHVLGKPLADLVFHQCHLALKADFGLEPPLEGPKGDMWIAPSDLLIGKVALTPPLTRKHIQALTHEGIIAIGYEIEKKFMNEMEEEKACALAHEKKVLLESFDDIIRAEVKDAEAREKAMARMEIERLTQEFENTLVMSLNNLEERLRREYETLIQNEEEVEQQRWLKTMEAEVQKTVEVITAQYLEKMAVQEVVLSKYFKHELSKAEIQRQYDLGKQDAKFRYRLQQLKHNLECKNLANMMYIICMERRKCYEEKLRIEKHYQAEIEKLKGTIENKKSVIKKLNKEKTVEKQEVSLRETCILEIIKQFQKFINFALRAAPTQAEFLLSVEKMMVFELVDAMLKSKVCATQPPCDSIQPWMTPERYLSEAEIPGLMLEDFHDCLNELSPPKEPAEGEHFLPAFTYKNRVYVREDFRDMILNGIELRPSDELWSKDVEILMNELKKVVMPQDMQHLSEKGSKDSRRSSILRRKHFDSRAITIEDKQLDHMTRPEAEDPVLTSRTIPSKSSLIFKKPVTNNVDFQKVGCVERNPHLLSTKSSLELIIEKRYVRHLTKGHEKEPENISEDKESAQQFSIITPIASDTINTLVFKSKEEDPTTSSVIVPIDMLDAKDSLLRHEISLLKKKDQWKIEPKDSIEVQKDSQAELHKKPSKLSTAKDSVELMRESKQKLRESIPCPHKIFKGDKDKADKRSVSSWSLKEPCCARCGMQPASSMDSSMSRTCRSPKETSSIGRKESNQGSSVVKLSSLKAINVVEYDKQLEVSFDPRDVVLENKLEVERLEKMYTPKKKSTKAEKKLCKTKDKSIDRPPTVAVVGQQNTKHHLQDSTEFTAERIHSFIELIKDHPNLIRTFTAVTR